MTNPSARRTAEERLREAFWAAFEAGHYAWPSVGTPTRRAAFERWFIKAKEDVAQLPTWLRAAPASAPPDDYRRELRRLAAFCEQTDRDGIMPTRAWFAETAVFLKQVVAQSAPAPLPAPQEVWWIALNGQGQIVGAYRSKEQAHENSNYVVGIKPEPQTGAPLPAPTAEPREQKWCVCPLCAAEHPAAPPERVSEKKEQL